MVTLQCSTKESVAGQKFPIIKVDKAQNSQSNESDVTRESLRTRSVEHISVDLKNDQESASVIAVINFAFEF